MNTRKNETENEPRLLLSVPETARRLRMGVNTVKALLSSGELRFMVVGKRRLIPATEIEAWIARSLTKN